MLVRSCLRQRPPQPCRLPPSRPGPHTRHFHPTTPSRDDQGLPNHYETLSLPTSATAAEIKKQFYSLSKSHHPDLHPNDPEASNRFVRISEAYSTLGSPTKRARYDRDLARSQPNPSHARSGSYSSASSPAGGRPASGLSRRRTQFRGPPPSFYRSGGWGAHSEKRGEAASQASHAYEAGGASSGATGAGGTGPGGFSMGDDNDVPHFDRQGHTRTHSEIERTRHRARRTQQRRVRREEELDDYAGASAGWGFVSICAVLLATAGIPVMMGWVWNSGREQGRRIVRERES